MGPPWGTWGPYLRIPSVEYFPKVLFWNSWPPGPTPKKILGSSKKIKIFPRDCELNQMQPLKQPFTGRYLHGEIIYLMKVIDLPESFAEKKHNGKHFSSGLTCLGAPGLLE